MELISDPADPRVEPFRDVKERDLVTRQGRFIAEGEVVLRRLLESEDFEPLSVLVSEPRFERLYPVVAARRPGVAVFAASQGVFDEIVGFHIHRGILAVGRRVRAPSLERLAEGEAPRLVVGLMGVANHDNMGGLFRNAAAFGVDGVVLDAGSCDPLYRKALRVSVGAALTTPWVRLASGVDLVDGLASRGFDVFALTPSGETELSDLAHLGRRTAVLFGAEGPGLPPSVLGRCRRIRIAMAGGFDSLNVATTSGVVLHHLRRLAHQLI